MGRKSRVIKLRADQQLLAECISARVFASVARQSELINLSAQLDPETFTASLLGAQTAKKIHASIYLIQCYGYSRAFFMTQSAFRLTIWYLFSV